MPNDISVVDRVAAGVAWLDQQEGPLWVERVNLDWLDIASADHCVLGQLYGEYVTSPLFSGDRQMVRAEARQAVFMGFSPGCFCCSGMPAASSLDLTQQWRLVIADRQQQLADAACVPAHEMVAA